MMTKEDITAIFSAAYAKASLADDCNMRLVADLFETVRNQIDIEQPYSAWDYIILDTMKFDNDYTIKLLLSLREAYFSHLYEKLLTHLNNLYPSDEEEALQLWRSVYAEAAVHYRYDLVCLLSRQRKQWNVNDSSADKYEKLSGYIRENRWVDALPFYEEIAENKEIDNVIRAFSSITMMEIVLYYYPENSKALKHLDLARTLLPDHFITKRAESVYFLRTSEIQKARNGLLQVISMKSADYVSFNFMGDCFFAEAKYENAEDWYHEAIQKNLLHTESYRRLLFLYGDKSWFREKEPMMIPLLEKIEKRRETGLNTSFDHRIPGAGDCFKDLVLFDSYRDVGASWFAVQNYEKSEEWYFKAMTLQPDVVAALLDLAYVKQAQKLPDEELQYFLRALKTDPNHFDVHWGLAFYYQDHGNKELALNHFNECLRLRPHWSDWVNNFIGNLFYSFKEYHESEIYYRKSVETNTQYMTYRQNLAGALEAQADQLSGESQQTESERLYLAAVGCDTTADRWNKIGNFYYRSGRWNEAADCYHKAITLNETIAVFHENLGLAFENLHKTSEAEQSYLKALELDKESGRYFNRLGVFYFNNQLVEKAIEYYHKAIDIEPGASLYYENMAFAYEIKQQPDTAIVYYEKALSVNPQSGKIYNSIGLIYFNRGEYGKSIEYYRKAVALDENNGVFLTNLAMALNYSDQKEEAFELYKKAVQYKDDYYLSWNDLGVLFYERGEMDEAIGCYQKSIALLATNPVIFSNLALAFNAQGKVDEARAVINHPLLNAQIRKETDELIRQNIPELFN